MTKTLTWHDFYEWSIKNRCDDCGWEEDKRPCEDVMYVRFGNCIFYQDGDVIINLKGIKPNKMNNIVFVINGIKDTLPNFARKFHLNPKMLYSRYYKNNDVKYVFKEVFNG